MVLVLHKSTPLYKLSSRRYPLGFFHGHLRDLNNIIDECSTLMETIEIVDIAEEFQQAKDEGSEASERR